MAELGDDAPSMHRRVGEAAAAAGVDMLLVGGDFAGELARGARDARVSRPDRLIAFARERRGGGLLRTHARAGDVVLLKASRKYRLEEIVEGLRAR